MPAALELSDEKDIHHVGRAFHLHETRSQREHVGVVMLARKPHLFVGLGRRRAHARHFVRGNRHSHTRRAD